MYEPIPGTSPKAITSKVPPSDSLALRAASISATIASLASASSARTGDSSTASKSAGSSPSRGGAATLPMRVTCERMVTPSSRRKALASAPAATRAAVSRAEARSRTLRASVKPYFWRPARSACPGRGRCTSATSPSTGHGFIRSSQFW